MIYLENFIQGNHSKGIEIIPEGIVLHHTGFYSKKSIISHFTNTESQASAHVVIWKDGSRTVFCKDNQRAWHAGKSGWQGRYDCNSFMLGVEFHGDTNKEQLTNEQVFSFTEWIIPKKEAWDIKFKNITDHRTVSPGRKVDLNPYELLKIQTHIKYLF